MLLLPRGLVWLFGLRGGVRDLAQEPGDVQRMSARRAPRRRSGVALRIENVGMRFGGLWALSEVSFDVERGSGRRA